MMNSTVKQAIARVFASAKTWTVILGMFTTAGASALASWGLEVNDAVVAQIAITISALFGILLHAQGQTDAGKEAAKINATAPVPANTGTQIAQGDIVNPTPPTPPTAGTAAGSISSIAMVMLVAIAMVGGALTFAACGGGMKTGVHAAGRSFADCLNPNTKALAGELRGTMTQLILNATDGAGKVDHSSLKSVVGSYKSDAPLCAFQAAVKGILAAASAPRDPNAPQSAELAVDTASLTAGYPELNDRLPPLESGPTQ